MSVFANRDDVFGRLVTRKISSDPEHTTSRAATEPLTLFEIGHIAYFPVEQIDEIAHIASIQRQILCAVWRRTWYCGGFDARFQYAAQYTAHYTLAGPHLTLLTLLAELTSRESKVLPDVTSECDQQARLCLRLEAR